MLATQPVRHIGKVYIQWSVIQVNRKDVDLDVEIRSSLFCSGIYIFKRTTHFLNVTHQQQEVLFSFI